ncbi:alpha/beta fold hydrolase [Amycolatopsis rhabdoformis]|uniref:Alpha/beta fold hydrolase n=1 Tax=Amycolatopsis rhabdoformis TaxID=1448059 RepID=A0ABZ1IG52_9PSEU|nr:alpha/beta fold hydrolase [Amycolatopsis rhabdoformis]WSE32539.1 alpha/beta fold hydrolase [Amycolatopsis rhabdoformis]
MKRSKRIGRVAAAVTAVAAVAVAGPAAVHYGPEPAAAAERPRPATGQLLSARAIPNLDPVLAAVSARADRITYRSRSLDGRDIVVSGALLTPKGRAPKQGWPVVSWAHGSSGIIDACAPSTAPDQDGKVDLFGYGGFLAQVLKAGYAVAATDYEGLGTEGEHPYIVADSEGRGVIDAVRAAAQADPAVSKSYFAVGHSQGGQAAIAAGELARTYGAGLDFRGTVGLAPVTDVGQAYSYGSPGPVDRGFYLLALHGLKTVHPELQYDQYLGKQALALLPKAMQECTDRIWTDFNQDLGAQLNDFQFTPQTPAAALHLQDWLDGQTVPRVRASAPMLLLQGDQDPSIKKAVTRQAVRNAGAEAEFRLYPGDDHYAVLGPCSAGGAADDVVAWLDRHRRE